MAALTQAPARDVELVRALVARVAVAVVPVPVPVVVEAVPVEGTQGGGAQPHVVVDLGEVGGVVGGLVVLGLHVEAVLLARLHGAVGIAADVGTGLEAQAPRQVDVADPALVDELDGLLHDVAAAVHGADLDEAVVVARGVDHAPSFPHGVGGGLLHEHVLARLHGPDGGQGVPVVGDGDEHRVHVLVVEHAPQVLHRARLECGDVGELGVVHAAREQVGVDVAQGLDLDVLEGGEAALERVALSADADVGQHHAVVGAQHAPAESGRGLRVRARRGRAAQGHARHRLRGPGHELAPCDLVGIVGSHVKASFQAAGCSRVMQCRVPRPQTSSPRMPRASRSLGSLNVGTRTAALAT